MEEQALRMAVCMDILEMRHLHYPVVQILLLGSCDLTLYNRWGRTALHEACSSWNGPPHTVELLLMAGMIPDIKDSMDNTPLVLAALR